MRGPHSNACVNIGGPQRLLLQSSVRAETGCLPERSLQAVMVTTPPFFLVSSAAISPFLSNLMSRVRGLTSPDLNFPRPSPSFHPIFFSMNSPKPPLTFSALLNCSALAQHCMPRLSSPLDNTLAPVLPTNCPGLFLLLAQLVIICCASYISARASALLGSDCRVLMAFSLRDTMVPMSTTGAGVESNTLSGSLEMGSLTSPCTGGAGAGRARGTEALLRTELSSEGFGLSCSISAKVFSSRSI